MRTVTSAPRPYLGQGLKFPLEVVNGRLALSRGERKIEESIHFILGTARGERIMRPDLGCGVHDLVFSLGNSATRTRVTDMIREALVLHEPRIDVLEVGAESPRGTANLLLIRIAYRIRANNAVTNLVYPYFITEGV